MAVIREDFEGGSDGAIISAAATNLDLAIGSIPYDDATAAHGTLSALTTGASYGDVMGINTTGGASSAASFAFRFSAIPATTFSFCSWYTDSPSAGNNGKLQIRTDGTLRVVDRAGSPVYTSPVLSANTWYWVDAYLTSHATEGVFVGSLHVGDPTNPAVGTWNASALNTGSGVTEQIRWGALDAIPVNLWLDDLAVETNGTTPPGLASVATDGVATFSGSITHTTDSFAPADRTYRIDATASIGVVTLTQTGGTTASVTQSPTGVFTFADPGGSDNLTFDLVAAGVNGGADDTLAVTISRTATSLRPAILTFNGGTTSDLDNWG